MPSSTPLVLVAPLNWGLGHATRCIPVIHELMRHGAHVAIAAEGAGKYILERTFPDLTFVALPGIKIEYPVFMPVSMAILAQMPALFRAARKEHILLQELVERLGITHVISDNRFGLYASGIPCVFLTHQVHISGGNRFAFAEPLLFAMNRYWISKFQSLWIVDSPPPHQLAGRLSDATGIRIPHRYTGMLSRFSGRANAIEKKHDVIALLSGPEPQRTAFEKSLLVEFESSRKRCLLIRGTPGENASSVNGAVDIWNTVNDEVWIELLHPDTLLVCRPGYSTLMDLSVLGHCKTVFIPTPGQTEQEYLARRLQQQFGYSIIKQGERIPYENIPAGKSFDSRPEEDKLLLESAVADLLRRSS